MCDSEIEFLKAQLATARSEIKNLRQQLSNLQHMHTKEIQNVMKILNDYRCDGCREKQQQNGQRQDMEGATNEDDADVCTFKPIGVIKTVFNEKRAVPRQASLATALLSRIDISPKTFNNPGHSLDGLENFSHLWIIYYFHRNPNHAKAKVAPPRLGGERVGVFSTRSPHRPCPIGLSLVQLDRVEDSKVYFLGTDMVDGTPVLDIKPYIPQYDVPVNLKEAEFLNSREAPDGEETTLTSLATALLSRIDISPKTFNNPAHSLDGLENFSHLWIIYYFHRNPNHAKAKVAPPRLGGERVGVFSTRSPHRPCPIGLSLVQLDRVEDSKVYFLGTDMVDGTPVLDIKPYIPQYDVPVNLKEAEFLNSREAPDGEETTLLDRNSATSNGQPLPNVSVPNWVLNSSSLNVMFNANAESQLEELQIEKVSAVAKQ
uniref:TsaA-like domain-containing protein n=1 Tax=Anopheles coluzzii TaxID=1518534 RepID=A0A8W7PNR6_ANOCL